jgi:hypothetical protein
MNHKEFKFDEIQYLNDDKNDINLFDNSFKNENYAIFIIQKK